MRLYRAFVDARGDAVASGVAAAVFASAEAVAFLAYLGSAKAKPLFEKQGFVVLK